MKIAKEGKIYLLVSSLVSGFLWKKNRVLGLIGMVITGFIAFFFRDPERTPTVAENGLLAPADGTIINIEDVIEEDFIKGPAVKISIFMSLFDVHINRTPVSGSVAYLKHIPGKFLPAYHENASFDNEQTLIGIETTHGKILMKQVAGLVARRIVCNLREGDMVDQGEKIGMIKFSSRAEVFFKKSNNVKIKVNVMDQVFAGETILAEYSD
jgi:phosphatidylserine decarboxylase